MFGIRILSRFERREIRDRRKVARLAKRYVAVVLDIESLCSDAKIALHETFDRIGPWLGLEVRVEKEKQEEDGFTRN